MTGTRTTNLTNRANVIDELIGNREGSTTIIEFEKFATQLAGAGGVRALIDAVRKTLEDDLADLSDLVAGGAKLNLVDPVAFQSSSQGALATAFAAGTIHNGHTAVLNERFFLNDRGVDSGLYTVTSGAPVRTADANEASELPLLTFLDNMSGNNYTCITPAPITIGTTVLKFKQSGKSASVLPSLAAGQKVSDPSDARFALLNAAGDVIQLISWPDLFAKINGEVMGPKIYTWPAHGRATDSSAEIIPADPGIVGFDIIVPGDGEVWAAEGNLQASIGGLGSIPVQPHGIYSTDKALPGAVSVIAALPTPVTCKFWTTTAYNVAARQAAQAYTARVAAIWGGTLTPAMITALQDFYGKLYSAGALSVLGAFYNLSAPGVATNINLCDLNGKLATLKGGVTRTNWRYASFDGTSGYFDTQRYMTEFAAENDHCVLAYPADATQQGSTRVAIGDGNITLTPARTNVTVAGRSRQTSIAIFNDVPAGPGLYSLSRLDPDRVVLRKGQSIQIEQALTADSPISQREILIGARNGGLSGGEDVPAASSFYIGPMVAAGAGRRISSAMHKAIDTAIAELVAATGAF